MYSILLGSTLNLCFLNWKIEPLINSKCKKTFVHIRLYICTYFHIPNYIFMYTRFSASLIWICHEFAKHTAILKPVFVLNHNLVTRLMWCRMPHTALRSPFTIHVAHNKIFALLVTDNWRLLADACSPKCCQHIHIYIQNSNMGVISIFNAHLADKSSENKKKLIK